MNSSIPLTRPDAERNKYRNLSFLVKINGDESNDSYTELIDSQHVALQKPRLLRTHKRLVILAPEWFLTTSRVALVYAVGAILRKRFLELDAEKQRSFRPKSIHLSDCLRQSLCKIQDSLPTFNGIMNLQVDLFLCFRLLVL